VARLTSTSSPVFLRRYTKPIKRCWPLEETSPRDTNHRSHRGQDKRNEEACSFSSPKAAAISFTYSTSLRLRTSIAISCGDHGNHRPPAWYAGQIKSIASFSKSLLVVHLCRRSTIVHVKADKHYHPVATFVLKMTMDLRFIDAYVSCSYQTLLGSASPCIAGK
jgi:hypothetical protein